MKYIITILLIILSALAACAQTIVGRQQVITVKTGDYTYPTSQALLWLPDDYNSTKNTYPIIIANHGLGEAGTDINKLIKASPIQIAGRIANGWNPVGASNGVAYKFIVFTPQCPVYSWSSPHLLNMLNDLKTKYRINDSAVFITGLSAGAWGEWKQLADDNFAKQIRGVATIAPMSPDNINWMDKAAARNIPVWFICGTADDKYTVHNTMYNYYKGAKIKTDIKGAGHTTWQQAYDPNWYDAASGNKSLYDWFASLIPVKEPQDKEAPIIELVRTTDTTTLPKDSVMISASAKDNVGVVSTSWDIISGSGVVANNTALTTFVKGLKEGITVVRFTAKDAAGNISTAEQKITVSAAPPTKKQAITFTISNLEDATITIVGADGTKTNYINISSITIE